MSFIANKLICRSRSTSPVPTNPTWNTTTLPAATVSGSWRIAYGEGRFVAILGSSSGSQAAYSDDGITWTPTSFTFAGGNWFNVVYGNGRFIANRSGGVAAYSDDGVNWTSFNMPTTNSFTATYGDNKFVAIGIDSTVAAYSLNGTTWTTTTLPENRQWQEVTYGKGVFVAIANTAGQSSVSSVIYSTDGITWNASPFTTTGPWRTIAYGNGTFVMLAAPGSQAAYSYDGINWSLTPIQSGSWYDVAYGNGMFTAIRSGSNVGYSYDGITWFYGTTPISALNIAYGEGRFVALTDNPFTNQAAYTSLQTFG